MTELSPRVIRVWFQNKRMSSVCFLCSKNLKIKIFILGCKDKKKTAAQQSRFSGDPKV